MNSLRPFVASDAVYVADSIHLSLCLDRAEWSRDLEMGGGWTMCRGEEPVACGGVKRIWEGYGYAWMVIGKLDPSEVPFLIRVTKSCLRDYLVTYRRIEANIEAGNIPAIRWAKVMGFKVIAKRRAFSPDGKDYFLYEIVTDPKET